MPDHWHRARLVRRLCIGAGALLCAAVASCSLRRGPQDPLEIRVANASSAAFDSVVITFPAERQVYGALAAGAVSDYRTVRRAYSIAPIRAYTDTSVAILQPIDFVGEALLSGGRYRYEIRLNTGDPRRLELTVARE